MRGPSSGAIEVFLMKKVGKRPAAQQAGEPVVNRAAVVHQATPKGSQGGRLSALSWGSVMPAKPAQPAAGADTRSDV